MTRAPGTPITCCQWLRLLAAEPDMRGLPLHVAAGMVALADDNGVTDFSTRELTTLLHRRRADVRKTVRALADGGWLLTLARAREGRGNAARYRLCQPALPLGDAYAPARGETRATGYDLENGSQGTRFGSQGTRFGSQGTRFDPAAATETDPRGPVSDPRGPVSDPRGPVSPPPTPPSSVRNVDVEVRDVRPGAGGAVIEVIGGLAERGLPIRGRKDLDHLCAYVEQLLVDATADELLERFDYRFDPRRAEAVRAAGATFHSLARAPLAEDERVVAAAAERGRIVRAAAGARPSTTDQRVAAGLALAAKYDALELERSAG